LIYQNFCEPIVYNSEIEIYKCFNKIWLTSNNFYFMWHLMWAWKFANQSKTANFLGQYFGSSQNVSMMDIKTTMTKFFWCAQKLQKIIWKKNFNPKLNNHTQEFFFKTMLWNMQFLNTQEHSCIHKIEKLETWNRKWKGKTIRSYLIFVWR
jgi:hypothetical protein